MRIFTCTPVAFGGGADFFARDSGLLCRGFQTLGVESRAIMPGERKPEDESDLIRTDYRNLESPEWWKLLNPDGVVLYSWGRPKYRKVAAAVHKAGIFLILNQDNGGLVSPLAGLRDWLSEQRNLAGRGACGRLRQLKLTLRGLSAGLLVTDPLRASHLKHGDVIACVSPRAAEHYRRLCRIYGGAGLTERVTVLPHAVETRFGYAGENKRRQIACVGRWHDEVQKRPWLLMRVISGLLRADDEVSVVIAGSTTHEMDAWHRSLAGPQRDRVHLAGRIGREELAEIMAASQVFYSPSAFESFGIAAAEALCSGCSVVAGRSVSMASFEWFVSGNSGRLAERDAAECHARNLLDELDAWAGGERDARAIADTWCKRFHAPQVARRIVGIMVGTRGPACP
jgi:hypothetical protein